MRRVLGVVLLCVYSCDAIIYHLNESEYLRMPPLYGLEEYGRCLVPRGGTYCLARLDLFTRSHGSLINLIHEYSQAYIKHYNHTYIQRGVCVTSTCKDYIKNNTYTTEDIQLGLARCLNESISKEYQIQAELTKLYYCETKGQKIDIDVGDWIVLGIYVAILAINIVGTLYDVIIISRSTEAIKGNKYILSFSIIRNWKKLVSAEPEEVLMKRLTGLHGARVLTIFLMFISHVMWVNSMSFNTNIHEFEELYENAYYQLIFNGLVVIQVFFVISGFLLVYNLEIHAEKHYISWGMAAKIWIMRWCRLTPSYAIVLAFMTTWLRHVGSGPVWRMFVTDSVVGDCRRYWWAHLLYINNYIADGKFCAIHTWHLATDTQLFCVGLMAYLLTRNRGRTFVLAVLITLGIILPAAHVWAWDLDALVIMTPEFYRTMLNDTFHYMHVYGHNNLVSYAVGMATGCLVYRLQKKGVDISDNKWCIAASWLVLPSVGCVLYSGALFYADGPRRPLAARVAYAAAHRLLIALAVAFGLLGLAMQFKTFLRSLFELRAWVVPSRLSYSVYLLHLSIIHAYIGLNRHLGHASTLHMTLIHFGVMLLTFMIALPFSLMVEAPLMRLMKISSKQDQTK